MALRQKHRTARACAREGTSLVLDEPNKPTPPEDATPRDIGGLEEMVLHGMQHKPHIYQGTVDPVTVAERRAANRRARRARRINRHK